MTVIHSALAGGDSIDDCDVLRRVRLEMVLGHAVLAPSTIGYPRNGAPVLGE